MSLPLGLTDCQKWKTDGWPSYQRVLPPLVKHQVEKIGTQRLERTNGILRQQTGKWHRHQNKFAKVWEQTEVTTRLVLIATLIGFGNIVGWEQRQHSELGSASTPWTWHDVAIYPTLA